jgi:hypothetical protein
VPTEQGAVARLLDELAPGDLGVILADKVPGVLAQVQARATGTAAVLP